MLDCSRSGGEAFSTSLRVVRLRCFAIGACEHTRSLAAVSLAEARELKEASSFDERLRHAAPPLLQLGESLDGNFVVYLHEGGAGRVGGRRLGESANDVDLWEFLRTFESTVLFSNIFHSRKLSTMAIR